MTRTAHDDKASGAHVLDVMPKVCGFLNRPSESNQGSLELSEKAMFGSAGIQATQVISSVKNIDVLSGNAGLKQCFDGRASALRIGERADNPVGRVAAEIAGIR